MSLFKYRRIQSHTWLNQTSYEILYPYVTAIKAKFISHFDLRRIWQCILHLSILYKCFRPDIHLFTMVDGIQIVWLYICKYILFLRLNVYCMACIFNKHHIIVTGCFEGKEFQYSRFRIYRSPKIMACHAIVW